LFDENGFRDLEMKKNYNKDKFTMGMFNDYLSNKIQQIFNKFISSKMLNFVFYSNFKIKKDVIIIILKLLRHDICSPENIEKIPEEDNYNISVGLFDIIFHKFFKNKVEVVNIEIKDDISNTFKNVNDIYDNIIRSVFYGYEIFYMYAIIRNQLFEYSTKYTFKLPNNSYIIYDVTKKILIIRFGNYEKHNFPKEKLTICQQCRKKEICSSSDHKQYKVNSFCIINTFLRCYPAELIKFDYEKLTKNVEKLIFINSEFHEFMFDRLLETAKNQKEKKIEYHCLNSDKTKFEQENFEFVPIEKESEYSFDQIYVKFLG